MKYSNTSYYITFETSKVDAIYLGRKTTHRHGTTAEQLM